MAVCEQALEQWNLLGCTQYGSLCAPCITPKEGCKPYDCCSQEVGPGMVCCDPSPCPPAPSLQQCCGGKITPCLPCPPGEIEVANCRCCRPCANGATPAADCSCPIIPCPPCPPGTTAGPNCTCKQQGCQGPLCTLPPPCLVPPCDCVGPECSPCLQLECPSGCPIPCPEGEFQNADCSCQAQQPSCPPCANGATPDPSDCACPCPPCPEPGVIANPADCSCGSSKCAPCSDGSIPALPECYCPPVCPPGQYEGPCRRGDIPATFPPGACCIPAPNTGDCVQTCATETIGGVPSPFDIGVGPSVLAPQDLAECIAEYPFLSNCRQTFYNCANNPPGC